MKKTIQNLKFYTNHKSDAAFARFIGVTENTITRAKAGHKTKLDAVLPMLEWFFSQNLLSKKKHNAFLKRFKSDE